MASCMAKVSSLYRPFGLREKRMNTIKVGLLLAALTGIFVAVGSLIGGTTGAIIAFALAALMNFGAYWFSDRAVLAATRARPLEPGEAPWLESMVAQLAARAELPTPRLYIVDDPQPNAFATGRDPQHGVVAVNTGLLRILDRDEVAGVIAHELAHIKSRDTLTMSIVATLAGAVAMLGQIAQFAAIFGGGHDEDRPNPFVLLIMAIVAPMAATLVQLGISRAREFEADALGARIAGGPNGLARALMKLERGAEAIPSHVPAHAAHLCIVNPLAGAGGVLTNLFRTHPTTEQRVQKLRGL